MADLSVTAANVAPISGTSFDTVPGEGIAGVAITAGQTLYIDTANANVLKLADANSSALTATVAGIALHGAAAGQPIKYAKPGGEYTAGATLTVGTPYFQSATAGGICPAADLATGHYTTLIGIAKSASVMRVFLATAGVAIP